MYTRGMSEYTWRVMKNNRFAGYVLAVSEWEALRKANDYYGSYVWVERLVYSPVSPKTTRLLVG